MKFCRKIARSSMSNARSLWTGFTILYLPLLKLPPNPLADWTQENRLRSEISPFFYFIFLISLIMSFWFIIALPSWWDSLPYVQFKIFNFASNQHWWTILLSSCLVYFATTWVQDRLDESMESLQLGFPLWNFDEKYYVVAWFLTNFTNLNTWISL